MPIFLEKNLTIRSKTGIVGHVPNMFGTCLANLNQLSSNTLRRLFGLAATL